jgi:Yip1 domain
MLEPTPGDPHTLSGGGGGPKKGLIERVKDILMSPKAEWGVIDNEASTIGSIFTGYVVILAAIGPIAMVIGHQVFGIYGFKPPMEYTIAMAALTYVLALVAVYVNSLIIDALAPSFGGTKDSLKAFKVAAYSATAAWVVGIFQIIPMLGFLAILGLYSLYLLYLGLPRLMRVAEDKAIGYTVVVIVVQIIIYAACFWIVGMLVLSVVGPMVVAPTMIRY